VIPAQGAINVMAKLNKFSAIGRFDSFTSLSLAVVRPGQYVAHTLPLRPNEEVAALFGRFLLDSR
jgi:hypothetical protein